MNGELFQFAFRAHALIQFQASGDLGKRAKKQAAGC